MRRWLLLDGTMGRMGRMGRMIMGQWDEGTVLWGTMGQWDGTPAYHAPRTAPLAQHRKRAAYATF